jgi:hypothetical protein
MMRRFLSGLPFVVLLVAVDGSQISAAPVSAGESSTVVIVFKDGHRQSIPASTISAMEFKSAAGVVTPIVIPEVVVPGRGRFLGKWVVGDGNGSSFSITLEENGEATKSHGEAHGTWVYVDGEARVSWDDGWHDAIRKVGSKYEKFAYEPGKPFSDTPSNVTEANNTSPRPI